MESDSGDLFCLAWNSASSTVYLGCQNTSIQWFSFTDIPRSSSKVNGSSGRHGPRAESLERLLLDTNLHSGTSTPRRAHKFFDSYPQYERKPADLNARNPSCSMTPPSPPTGLATPPHPATGDDPCLLQHNGHGSSTVLAVPAANTVWSAHYGYVYCMALVPSNREGSDDPSLGAEGNSQLITGSGDATVKVSLRNFGSGLYFAY